MKGNMKTYLKYFSIKKSSLYLLLILSLVIIVSLAIKQYYFRNREGLLTSTMMIKIEEALENYDSEVDKITTNTIKQIASSKLTQAESVTFSPILADEELKNNAKIEKIIKLKPSSKSMKDILADTSARKYKANLIMLNTINENTYADDETFSKLIESLTTTSYNIVSGDNSVSYKIREYINNISEIVPRDNDEL
jgi:hypothetical protein